MIRVTRLDRSEFYLNAEFIQSVESTPDTHIVLVNGHSYVVSEPDHEVVDRILQYRRSLYGPAGHGAPHLRVVEG
jgi:flagellar protein FlbD